MPALPEFHNSSLYLIRAKSAVTSCRRTGLKFKIRNQKPLNFLVKNYEGRVIEMAEVAN
jgi:hypothetical protein